MTRLRKEFDDPELIRLFAVANYLHQNFYEASMNVEAVKDSSEAVKQLIKKLEKML